MNELCKLKGHMWYVSERIEVKREDGIYSIAIKRRCTRCLEEEKLESEAEAEDV